MRKNIKLEERAGSQGICQKVYARARVTAQHSHINNAADMNKIKHGEEAKCCNSFRQHSWNPLGSSLNLQKSNIGGSPDTKAQRPRAMKALVWVPCIEDRAAADVITKNAPFKTYLC